MRRIYFSTKNTSLSETYLPLPLPQFSLLFSLTPISGTLYRSFPLPSNETSDFNVSRGLPRSSYTTSYHFRVVLIFVSSFFFPVHLFSLPNQRSILFFIFTLTLFHSYSLSYSYFLDVFCLPT